MFHVPEKHRIVTGRMGSDSSYGNNGAFVIPSPLSGNRKLVVIASDGMNWDHVSVHGEIGNGQFTPCWDEMCFLKELFWDDEDVVVQFHPRKSEYVNIHKHTLHLWRSTRAQFPTPDLIMV